jgi:hypothetical protein
MPEIGEKGDTIIIADYGSAHGEAICRIRVAEQES